jgi:hypothetical protein
MIKMMKLKKNLILLIALSILPLCDLHAVTSITYTNYTATSINDASWVNQNGYVSVTAVNFGGSETNFGGVTWLAGISTAPFGAGTYNVASSIDMIYSAPNQAWASNASVFASGANALLNDGAWSAASQNGVPFRIDLSGFTVGQQYMVQFILADTRGDFNGRTVGIDGFSANIADQDSVNFQYAFTDGRFAVITASFIAGSSDFSFMTTTSDGISGQQINAIQVLTVPEPSAALLGCVGVFALLRRRRA